VLGANRTLVLDFVIVQSLISLFTNPSLAICRTDSVRVP
jgi:hypothetical protein